MVTAHQLGAMLIGRAGHVDWKSATSGVKMALTEAEILASLQDGPRYIYGGMPRDLYFDLQDRGLITMRQIPVDSQETAIEVRLSCSAQGEKVQS